MARHDVYRNLDGGGYLLDVQSDLLDGLQTRVVIPLMHRPDAPLPAARLNPVFDIEGAEVVAVTQFLAAVPVAILGPPMANLHTEADRVMAALDMLTIGF